jgi:putative resolvase
MRFIDDTVSWNDACRSPTNRRYYTHEQYLAYRGLISSEQGLVIAYARVSSPGQKKDLAIQKEALRAYCQEHAIKVDQWIEEIGSALNYKRKGFNQIIEQIELGLVMSVIAVLHAPGFSTWCCLCKSLS